MISESKWANHYGGNYNSLINIIINYYWREDLGRDWWEHVSIDLPLQIMTQKNKSLLKGCQEKSKWGQMQRKVFGGGDTVLSLEFHSTK